MKTSYAIALLVALLSILTGLLTVPVQVHSSNNGSKAPAGRADLARVKESYSKIPLSFVANHGQAGKTVKFTSRGSSYSLALTPTTFTLAVADPRNNKNERASAAVVQATLLGGNPAAKLTGLERLITRTNYFIGKDPRKWKTNVPNYAKVKYSDVYRGVDLLFYGNQNLLEYDFIVSPGADPGVIALGFEGMTGMRVDENGDLILRTDAGEVRQSRPVVYQQIDGGKQMIPAAYLIKGEKQVAFQIGNYDRSKPLVIDPTLAFSTYLGGSGSDLGEDIAVDSAGNAYITGGTTSPDFPVTHGAFQTVIGGNFDAFITKMNSTGTALIYSTYFGGGNRDFGNGIAIDAAGNAYITGLTEGGIPTTPGAFSTVPIGSDDFFTFAMKLNATGTALVYSTFLGPILGNAIAVDSGGNAYITGQAIAGFPTTPGAFQTVSGGGSDAFVTKLNATGSALVYSSYLGGSGPELSGGIALDSAGSAYVAGGTHSNDFPVREALQPANKGNGDFFLTKVAPDGKSLEYSTYLGGTGFELGSLADIAVDATGAAYVGGATDSGDYPVTPGAFQEELKANEFGISHADAVVTKLAPGGAAIVYSTYVGGLQAEYAFGIALDTLGQAHLVGQTNSNDFPTQNALAPTARDPYTNGFIAKLAPDQRAMVSQRCGLVAQDPGNYGAPVINFCKNAKF